MSGDNTRIETPVWRLVEELTRQARESIEGRARFERYVRPSTKPLRKVRVDPHDLLRLLDALAERDAAAGENERLRAKVEALVRVLEANDMAATAQQFRAALSSESARAESQG